MIEILISGKLTADPEPRTSAAGKEFVTARLAAGTGDDSVLCSLVAFGEAAGQLAAMAKGDALTVVGRAKPTTWTARDGALKAGLDVVAQRLLTVHHAERRCRAMQTGGAESGRPQAGTKARPARHERHATHQGRGRRA